MSSVGSNQNAPIAVGVLGARGRMGSLVCEAIRGAVDLDLVATVDSGESLSQLELAEVVVDFTVPDVAMDHVAWCIEHGKHAVVGTSGFDEQRLAAIRNVLGGAPSMGVMVVPNFGIGAVLMMHWAKQAAKFFPDAEVLEYHHAGKVDAPSGTAIRTAELIAEGRREAGIAHNGAEQAHEIQQALGSLVDGVPVHASRGAGFIAHQDVIFGAAGERLTIRHDSLDRASFMPGVLLAIRSVAGRPGLTVGLEPLLQL